MTKLTPSASPARAGGDDDELGAVFAHVLGGESRARDDLDVCELGELDAAPVQEPAPLAEPGKTRDPARDPADLGLCLDEVDTAEAALAEDDGALHPRRARADDENVAVAVLGRLEALGVPPAPVLLAGRGVLRTPDVVPFLRLHHADVAADALAHLAVAALLDLLREERVGDGRPRSADQVPGARADDLRHAVGVGEPAHADDRLRRRLAHVTGPFELVALLEEARRARVLRPFDDRADVHVPQIHQGVGQADEAESLLQLDAGGAERLHAESNRDHTVFADRLADDLERLEPEAGAVLQRAPVFVRALVVERREELERQVRVAAVDVDDVEAGVADELRGAHPVLPHAADVVELHRLGDDPRVVVAGELRGAERGPARLTGRPVNPTVRQLDPRKGAVLVSLLRHLREVPHVVGVPDALRDNRPEVRIRADERFLRADGRPATLGLRAPKAGLGARLLAPEAGAVRHLVEPVPKRLRPDLHGLEEDVVAGIARHGRG